jgi:hypothetical protein
MSKKPQGEGPGAQIPPLTRGVTTTDRRLPQPVSQERPRA